MFIPSFSPLVGGAERQAQQLSRMLIRKGIDVFILTRQIRGTNSYESVDGVPVYRTYASNSIFFLFSSLRFLIKNRSKYNIIHVHTPDSPAITASIVRLILNKRIVVKIRRTGEGAFLDRIADSIFRRLCWIFLRSVVDCWIAINREAVKQLFQLGISRNRIVETSNGIDSELFQPLSLKRKHELRSFLPFPAEYLLCLFVGRLIKRKGVGILIQSLAEVMESFPQLHLMIIGMGNEEANLRNLVEKHNLGPAISFMGEISRDEVLVHLQMGDVFILPSESEGMPNALLEAMSVGLPVIATRIAGIEEVVVDGKNGFLVQPGSRTELSNALLRLAEDSSLLCSAGQQSRAIIDMAFSLDYVADKYIQTYRKLLGRSN